MCVGIRTRGSREPLGAPRRDGESRSHDRTAEAVILTFGSGASMTIPRRVIPGLEREPASILETVVLSPAGNALRWPALDVDVHVPGLIERAFGGRLLVPARKNHYSK